ncbi:alpha-mannosidase [bacterium]|nr:alpha-mannosidase [bacterium]
MLHKTRWTVRKIEQRIALLESLVYRRRQILPNFRYTELPGDMDKPLLGADGSTWQEIKPDTYWGKRYTNFMMQTDFAVPTDWDADAPVALYLPLGESGDFSHPEALAYVDGESYAACDRHHQEIRLPDRWRDGKTRRLDLHGWTGLLGFRHGQPDPQLFMRPCAVVQIDQPTRDFVATARVAQGIARWLDDNEKAKGQLLNALDDAFKLIDLREPFGDAFYESIPAAHTALKDGIAKAGPPMDVSITATGHAHIDVAWLWTLGQTRRKAGRTFHTALRLMEQFPDYHFTQSQPQLYDYLTHDYPELLDAIKERVKEGRWEVIGGMWVEADCNLSGPESLARQFLLGRTFFREHFGPEGESPVLWLPDVFGYAWNLPQLIKEAGMEYFFTIKIGWSQYNRLPFDSFWWQGLDGTKVLTHFSTAPDFGAYASTYNANAEPRQVLGTWTNFQQKELQDDLLMAFGWGDGGGGPTREMLENIREMGAFPATPQMKQGPVGDFYRRLEAESGDRLPTWNGELYLELHRGTYTTQSRNKRANRKSEFLLHDAEFVATLAALVDPGYAYPAQSLRKAWEVVCLNQFHDIIPGSSIGPVYTESLAQYEELQRMATVDRDNALAVIASQTGGDVLLVNPTGFERADPALWKGELGADEQLVAPGDVVVSTQQGQDGVIVDAGALLPYSVTPLTKVKRSGASPSSTLTASEGLLENSYLRVEINHAGDVVRIFDKANGREVLPAGGIAGEFQAFEDRPMNWDAWDVDIFFDDKMWHAEPAKSIRVVETGPLRATVEIKRRVLNSEYTQRISLSHNSPRLDFDTHIDWRERHILLKVAFPVDVLTPTATYEIQWGNTERPTHRNTSWDWARFETAAQKWVDLSEGDYGVSLLNDCKYGHDIKDNVMRISLLRAPTSPDPEADQGEHRFAYSLLPHRGRWDESTIREAYAINDPLLAYSVASPASTPSSQHRITASSFLSVDAPNVVIETVKRADDSDGVIVRLYETQRRRGNVTLTAGFDLSAAQRVNLLEEKKEDLPVTGNQVTFAIKPYQIVTLRLKK